MRQTSFNQIPHLHSFQSLQPNSVETFKDLRAFERKYGIEVKGCGWYRKGKLTMLLTRPNKMKQEICVEIWDRIDPRDLMVRLARIEEY